MTLCRPRKSAGKSGRGRSRSAGRNGALSKRPRLPLGSPFDGAPGRNRHDATGSGRLRSYRSGDWGGFFGGPVRVQRMDPGLRVPKTRRAASEGIRTVRIGAVLIGVAHTRVVSRGQVETSEARGNRRRRAAPGEPDVQAQGDPDLGVDRCRGLRSSPADQEEHSEESPSQSTVIRARRGPPRSTQAGSQESARRASDSSSMPAAPSRPASWKSIRRRQDGAAKCMPQISRHPISPAGASRSVRSQTPPRLRPSRSN